MNDPHSATEVIVSFDLQKESYQTLWNHVHDMQFKGINTLGVVSDCLYSISSSWSQLFRCLDNERIWK
ncbi:hypothetical protein MTR_1g115155 [Medicago truncatula]|uniref:Uncharacterized protein n=1 Tax=Medicago truncatula TaxID=3880 RepID=A0A072VRZ2_MEDTR|nr:hypothetical protein MTR_1g115155 [Medicago truncatula]